MPSPMPNSQTIQFVQRAWTRFKLETVAQMQAKKRGKKKFKFSHFRIKKLRSNRIIWAHSSISELFRATSHEAIARHAHFLFLPIFPARLLIPFVAEQLVPSRGTIRSEQDTDGIADRHHRAVGPVRHQPDDARYHNAVGAGRRRRQDALPLLRRQAGGRGWGRGARRGYTFLVPRSDERERDQKHGALAV